MRWPRREPRTSSSPESRQSVEGLGARQECRGPARSSRSRRRGRRRSDVDLTITNVAGAEGAPITVGAYGALGDARPRLRKVTIRDTSSYITLRELEVDMCRSIVPWLAELVADPPRGQACQPTRGERRSQRVADQVLQALAILRPHCDIRVHAEALDLRTARRRPRRCASLSAWRQRLDQARR